MDSFLSTWMRRGALLCGSVLAMVTCGCRGLDRVSNEWDRLEQSYQRLVAVNREAIPHFPPTRKSQSERHEFGTDWGEQGRRVVTLVAEGLPWSLAVADVAEQAGLSVALPASGEGQPVTVRLVDVAAQDALELLAGMHDKVPLLVNGVVTFVPETVAALGVVPAGYLSGESAGRVVERVVGQGGSVTVAGGNVVVAGRPDAVERAVKMGEWFDRAEPEQWGVSVWIVEVSREWRQRLGVEIGLSGSVAGLVTGSGAEVLANVLLESVIDVEFHRRHGQLLTHASVVVVDGETASVRNVASVPVPERATSPQGTVTTTGYSMIDAGLILNLRGRSVPGGGLHLRISPELSSVTGFVEDHPIIAKRSMDFSAQVTSGEWVIVSGLDEWRSMDQQRGIFGLAKSAEQGVSSVIVIMRAARLGRGGNVIAQEDSEH